LQWIHLPVASVLEFRNFAKIGDDHRNQLIVNWNSNEKQPSIGTKIHLLLESSDYNS
jgi:hypothetical protein